MHKFTIRELDLQDEAFLYDMMYEAIYIPEGGESPSRDVVQLPELRKYVADFGSQSGDLGYVAVDNNSELLLGAAWLRLFTRENRGYGYVDSDVPELSMAVSKAYRGRGIGTSLLKHLLQTAQRTVPAVSLSVWPDNPAYRLYKRFGFSFVEKEKDGPAFTLIKRF